MEFSWDFVMDILERIEFWTSFALALVSFLSGWFGKRVKDKRQAKRNAETVHLQNERGG